MPPSRLAIDTTLGMTAGPSSVASSPRDQYRSPYLTAAGPSNVAGRMRSSSNASTSSSLSIISPGASSSTNVSTTSLPLPGHSRSRSRSRSPRPEFVLAMHDYAPDSQSATCLSFRAGQVIRVLNRDPSGWWDGELEGRRGWFPSNYVNTDIASLTKEEPPEPQSFTRSHHNHSKSVASTTSWLSSVPSHHSRNTSQADTIASESLDTYCPPAMIPLLQGLSLLQNTVRANRIDHFQPSAGCIISCVRSILSATSTLQRESPILQDFPLLAEERSRVLTALGSLVAQAKKASEGARREDTENMLRLGGQVFAHMRRFLSVAVECDIELPESLDPLGSGPDSPSSPNSRDSIGRTPTQNRQQKDPTPSFPSALQDHIHANKLKVDPRMRAVSVSVSSISSLSSYSSQESAPPNPPPFPCGPTSSARVLEALRFTHDHYLSTIAAFIGHAHSHSRSSHASSTGHLYDLVKEIVEMVAKGSLYEVTNSLTESVRSLTLPLPPGITEEDEKGSLLRSATNALRAGADCVASVKVCLNRSISDRPYIINLPSAGGDGPQPFTPSKFTKGQLPRATSLSALQGYCPDEEEDLTIQAQTPSPVQRTRQISSSSETSSKSSWRSSDETGTTSPDEGPVLEPLTIPHSPVEPGSSSPISLARTDDGTTWEGSIRSGRTIEDKMLPTIPLETIAEVRPRDPEGRWLLEHDYSTEDAAYNSDGILVGATLDVLVEKMTPHDSIVDPAFSAVFFLTFRLFASPIELVDVLVARYNLSPPHGISYEELQFWQQRKALPVRLRVSNFLKMWVEQYWRPGVDDRALPSLTTFTRDGLALLFPGPAQRILELLNIRRQSSDLSVSPKPDRSRDPGMSINPPVSATISEIPRPTMTKTLLASLRKRDFASISVTDFDALELARQLTIMECNLYCAIQPEEILETGQEGVKPPVNVKAVSSLSTVITGWVAESILNEPELKKRTLLVKFFVKVADRCSSLSNYSTSRSILAALDSSTISRLHQTWLGLPQKYKMQLEGLRRLADHSRNYHEYRSKLRNTAPPAVPFLGLYLTDVTFCREGNPSHRASPVDANKKLLNFNKYHKLARIVQDMQRFQVPYNLKAIPEVQEYLNVAFQNARQHGDLQDLYRRSLLVEPKQPADHPPTGDMRQLFNWGRSQTATTPL
ncbi:ras guanine nucleotide exchange factor domain-containing protein [Cyathus striatus]|nr:ras guanine nucleotide exchange factor domain-containing protein [Cyathus striatus]